MIRSQRQDIARMRDNDLKYRYIQLKGYATESDVEKLRDMFEFNRAEKAIRKMRKHVQELERLLKQEAEAVARAELKRRAAEKLKEEAEQFKK